ncbi:hypothetical protein ACHAQA_006506 [Verticillium albo-atrum]
MSTTLTITPSAQLTNPIKADKREAVERHGYLFGQKITHSLSPFLHGTIYNEIGLKWEQTRLDSADIPMFLELIKNPNFYGASVTMPNKVAIIPHLDELTDECRDVGACNTLFIRHRPDGSRVYCGTNTDVVGVRESFYQNVADPDAVFHNRPALVVGGGGAARSAVYALRKWMKVTDIYLVNRDDAEVQAVVDECTARGYGQGLRHIKDPAEVASLESVGAIVACVPNFAPQTAEEKAARAVIEAFLAKEKKGAMLEMCYNPTPFTELGALAENAGWQVILGTEAMIWQGLEQDRYWTGRELDQLPVKKVQEAIASRLAQASKL